MADNNPESPTAAISETLLGLSSLIAAAPDAITNTPVVLHRTSRLTETQKGKRSLDVMLECPPKRNKDEGISPTNETPSAVDTSDPLVATSGITSSWPVLPAGTPSGNRPIQPQKPTVNPSLVEPTKPSKSISNLKGFLHFKHKVFVKRFESKCSSVPSLSVVFEYSYLEKAGFVIHIDRFLSISGMRELLDSRHETYLELFLEFLSTFCVAKTGLQDDPDLDAEGTVQFRLCNKQFKMSLSQFGMVLGGVQTDFEHLVFGYPKGWTMDVAYRKLCEDVKMPPHLNAFKLRDISLRYAHLLIAINLSGRSHSDAGLMTKPELFILQCMTERRKLHVGFWAATLLSKLTASKRLGFGSCITGLARKLVEPHFSEEKITFHSEVKVLDFQALRDISFFDEPAECSTAFASPEPAKPASPTHRPITEPARTQKPDSAVEPTKAVGEGPSASKPEPLWRQQLISDQKKIVDRLDNQTHLFNNQKGALLAATCMMRKAMEKMQTLEEVLRLLSADVAALQKDHTETQVMLKEKRDAAAFAQENVDEEDDDA